MQIELMGWDFQEIPRQMLDKGEQCLALHLSLPAFCLQQVCGGELRVSRQELCHDWGMEVASQGSKSREIKGA